MSVEKEIRKILGEATPASVRAKQELVRSGLGHDKNAAAVMKALQNPEEAMKNPAKRDMLLKVMQDLLDVVVNDPAMVAKTKTALRKEEVEEESTEDIQEKLVGGQKKLDKNKNGKLDAEDFKKLRGEAKKPKAEAEDDEEDEDEMDDEDEKEEDEIENEKEDEKETPEPRKNFKGFKKGMKEEKAEEGYVSHAQRKAVWASRNDAKMKKEEVQLEQAPVAPAPIKHRIAVTVSEPDHTMVSKRKEQVLKHVVVSHGPNKESAQKLGEKFYKKRGYKVHGSEHVGIKEEVELDEAAWGKDKAANLKAALDRHSEKAIAANKAGDDSAVKVHQSKMNLIKNKMAKMTKNESVTTDYKLVKGQTQNKTPSEKLATDYKLATKKVAKVNEAKDPREYDYEGDMAKSQLRSIMANAKQAHDMLKDDTNMAEWVQSKITLAADYISTVADYMQSEVNEEVRINELKKATLKSYLQKKTNKPGVPSQKDVSGMANATVRLMGKKPTSEDVQIDEVSQKTVSDYKAKASEYIKKYKYSNNPPSVQKKLAKRTAGSMRADVRMKEDIQIDELKKSTLGSYVKKASKEYGRDKQLVGRESPSGMVKDARPEVKAKLKNRMAGIEKAADRLAKEETQVDEAFPTVADARKRMKDALKSKFEKKKISTGTVYTKKYKDEKDDEKKSDK
jgi:hypothetical protein